MVDFTKKYIYNFLYKINIIKKLLAVLKELVKIFNKNMGK